MPLTLAFVMDPLHRVNPEVDTTFALMECASQRGHRVLHVLPPDVGLDRGEVVIRSHEVQFDPELRAGMRLKKQVRVEAGDCAAIFIRTDPPFDGAYLTVTWVLSFAERRGVRVINSPRGLRSANEKLYAMEFAELCPDTIVSSSKEEIHQFIERVGGDAIIKPVDGHGGFGVARLKAGDSNINTIVDMLSLEGAQQVLVQTFIPEAAEGDKRLFLLDGKLRAAVMRIPGEGDHRSNVHVGGRVEACEIIDSDRKIAEAMGDRLREHGLYFVGLDVIGGKLTEVNVTSPTLIRELARLGGPDLAVEVIDSVEATAGR